MNISIHEDNAGALILAKTLPPQFTPSSKYYAAKTIWFREEIFKRGQDPLPNALPGGRGLPSIVWVLLLAIGAAVIGFYAFTFKVNPNQLGIVQQFGEFKDKKGPGLHFRWPYPVNEVLLPDVTRNNRIQIGMRSSSTGASSLAQSSRDVPEESLMLTGD